MSVELLDVECPMKGCEWELQNANGVLVCVGCGFVPEECECGSGCGCCDHNGVHVHDEATCFHPCCPGWGRSRMTGLHIESRPFPGHVPAPAPDLTKTAAGAIAAARRALVGPAEHPTGCCCSAWCRDEWEYHAGAIGECVAGDGPARSVDPEGRVRHPNCAGPA